MTYLGVEPQPVIFPSSLGMGVPKLCDFLSAKRLASGLDFLLPFDSIQGMSGYSNVPIYCTHTASYEQ